MNNKRKLILAISGFVLFILYIFGAAQPIPEEMVLSPRWINSLTTTYPVAQDAAVESYAKNGPLLPFQLGERFGYVDKDGNFTINQVKNGYISLSDDHWAEYEAIPDRIEVHNPVHSPVLSIEMGDRAQSVRQTVQGYPVFLDKRIFLINNEQNSIAALDGNGNVMWIYDFAATLTCIDAANGLLLTGSLDGVVEILNSEGKRIFFFEPGGSRLSIILACAFSKDGSKFAIVSGIDEQRFLLMERLGESLNNEYRVTYHEFVGKGFRRPVPIAFVDNDNRVAFERETGLGLYEISSRKSLIVPLNGEIVTIDEKGSDRLLFLLLAQDGEQKQLVTIKFPAILMHKAPFKSDSVFLDRRDTTLYIGGGTNLASFEITKR
ncbi:MAG: WD40 repeat domain-containing protein [Treponema sp.]|nr:WD40 repeat domain-containing protein [Treponema sp.]